MDRGTKGSGGALRRFTACLVVFALVLQGITFTLAGARLAADAAGTALGLELCRHDGGTAPGAPESPGADSHCIFCLPGAACVLGTATATPDFRIVAMTMGPWRFVVWRLPATTVDASARPRGPPLAA